MSRFLGPLLFFCAPPFLLHGVKMGANRKVGAQKNFPAFRGGNGPLAFNLLPTPMCSNMPNVRLVLSYGFCSKFYRPTVSRNAKCWKSVKIWQSYSEFKCGNFFETQCSGSTDVSNTRLRSVLDVQFFVWRERDVESLAEWHESVGVQCRQQQYRHLADRSSTSRRHSRTNERTPGNDGKRYVTVDE